MSLKSDDVTDDVTDDVMGNERTKPKSNRTAKGSKLEKQAGGGFVLVWLGFARLLGVS